MDQSSITERWQKVLEQMAAAARRAGRSPDSARLLAVSKLHSAHGIQTLFEAGQSMFGENYVQEALGKMAILPREISWHLIGHLQTNKVKSVVGRFALIHGVDSLKLARSLHGQAEAMDVVQDVLVQVNLAEEKQKSGILVSELPPLAEFLARGTRLRWRGLMLMPPFFDDPDRARPYFARLRELAEALRTDFGLALPELSMGMTGDFEAAIEEGATLVRIGTRIFGERGSN
ncbi:MAG: YggS family pyridoxal phosphate-dependent enzyme [Deltaproteobacteria bacterium HGW-Deltaproteobacteria-18]|nr:MAG: YggS family pyridoxal phosphate-dependent enzyme [Deltaproteobacteria bacterium HGW-Deltaproteobacteria-18]